MRSIWKGHLRVSLLAIQVKVYNGVDTSEDIKFNQLHKDCGGRIGNLTYCKKCEKKGVGRDEIDKGYEYGPNQYVVITPADLDNLKLDTTKIIDVVGFVEPNNLIPSLFEAPYLIGPDGDASLEGYAILRETLRQSDKHAIGKVVLQGREQIVALIVEDNAIVMYKLRYPSEIRAVHEIPNLDRTEIKQHAAVPMMLKLIETMTTPLSKLDLTDNYATAVRTMVRDKADGKQIIASEDKAVPAGDIMAILKASIKNRKKV